MVGIQNGRRRNIRARMILQYMHREIENKMSERRPQTEDRKDKPGWNERKRLKRREDRMGGKRKN